VTVKAIQSFIYCKSVELGFSYSCPAVDKILTDIARRAVPLRQLSLLFFVHIPGTNQSIDQFIKRTQQSDFSQSHVPKSPKNLELNSVQTEEKKTRLWCSSSSLILNASTFISSSASTSRTVISDWSICPYIIDSEQVHSPRHFVNS